MEKIQLGQTGMMVSRIGLGGIPIQRRSDDEAIAVVQRCLDLGVTFIDTATNYTNSEERIGKGIAGRREGLVLATKSMSRTRDDLEHDLKQSLERLGTESIDLYQFHNVSDPKAYNRILEPDGLLALLHEAKKQGLVKHIGITSHSVDIAREAVKSGRFETLMFPFNFVACEPAIELLSLCRQHDVGFMAMKPLAGGMLQDITIAFKYLLQFPDILLVVGIEQAHEIDEIIEVLNGSWQMTEAEQREMERLKQELGTRFCRRCGYCRPCPEGIPISLVMTANSTYKRLPPAAIFSGWVADVMVKAASCTRCGQCEEKCPYGLPIREMIDEHLELYQTRKQEYQEQITSHQAEESGQ